MCEIDWKTGIANTGDVLRLGNFLRQARAGERLTVGFIGGSITMGCLASREKLAYPTLVYEWLCRRFPMADLRYVNAGIGATTSHFGAARAEEDLLCFRPDLVFVEFSVNDDSTPFFCETYEGLIRRILRSPSHPAVVLIHNVRYDTGGNAQVEHAKIARHYHIPAVSMQSSIYPFVADGTIPAREITPDDLHPNDEGHALVASVITGFLSSCFARAASSREESLSEEDVILPEPLTLNRYEHTARINNRTENAQIHCDGFVSDLMKQESIRDVFRNGWTADREGAEISLTFTGTECAVQWRRTIAQPAPVAEVTVDGGPAVKLDANFEETWGDLPCLTPVLVHGCEGEHVVSVRIKSVSPDNRSPFYLISFLTA